MNQARLVHGGKGMIRQLGALTLIGACLAPPVFAQDKETRATAGARDTNTAAPIVRDPRLTDYLIGPEDMLDIFVWKNPELSRTVPVRPDGKISMPLVNDIQAAGLTPSQLREQVTAKLNEFVPQPEVTVMVREVHSVKVAVIGSVKVPNRYEIKTPATVLEMIAMAQGFSEFADRNGVVVLRQTGTTTQRIPFHYSKVVKGSDTDNFFVRPGDIIFVP